MLRVGSKYNFFCSLQQGQGASVYNLWAQVEGVPADANPAQTDECPSRQGMGTSRSWSVHLRKALRQAVKRLLREFIILQRTGQKGVIG